jgi:hypothetical protein
MSGATGSWEEIDINNEIVNIGDIYEFHYNVPIKFAGLEKKVVSFLQERSGKFEVISCDFSNSNDENDLVVKTRVISL